MPNSTARHNARATKPRHKQARTTQQHPRGDAATKHGRTNRDGHPHQAPRRDDHRPTGNGRGSWSDNHNRHGAGDGARSTGTRQGSWSDSPRRRDDRDSRGQARDHRTTGSGRGSWSDARDNRGARSADGRRSAGTGRGSWSDNPRRRDDRDGRGQGRDRRTSWSDDRAARDHRSDSRAPRSADRVQAAPAWDGEIVEDGRKPVSVSFAELGLPTPLLNALADAGINEPFPIQAATLPDALAGRDVLGRAQTGSGKTLAFGLALLTRLNRGKPRPGHPRGLVLVPTRELAVQVTEALMPLAKSLGLWCRTVVGGLSFAKQADQLQRGIDLLIATPGRLSDHIRQGTCVLDDVRFVALDEADQMADMGFLPQVRDILDLVPDGQRMLFSATLDRDVAALVDRYLTDPVTHSVSPATATVSTMDHHLLLVSPADKAAVVAEMAAREGRTIMFLRTKHHVDRLTKQLRAVGVRAGALHGGKPQGARNRVLGEFKDGSLPVLVATDVAARGIHVDGVSLVVHVDPPADAKGYLHRAGRTARAGEAGTVVTMVTHQERRTVFRMTEQAGVSPQRTTVRPGDADLARITGARVPTGEPVVDPEPTRRPPRRGNRFDRPRGRFRR